jgi:hypothetical protein
MECPKCTEEIGESSVECPKCGVNILEERKKMVNMASLPEGVNVRQLLSRNDDPGFSTTWIIIGIILAAISYYFVYNDITPKGALKMGPQQDTPSRSPFVDEEMAKKAFEKRVGKMRDLQKAREGK